MRVMEMFLHHFLSWDNKISAKIWLTLALACALQLQLASVWASDRRVCCRWVCVLGPLWECFHLALALTSCVPFKWGACKIKEGEHNPWSVRLWQKASVFWGIWLSMLNRQGASQLWLSSSSSAPELDFNQRLSCHWLQLCSPPKNATVIAQYTILNYSSKRLLLSSKD